MARIPRTMVAERETFATEQFKAGKSVKEVNALLKERDGKMMGLKRLYELRDNVLVESVVSETSAEASPQAETSAEPVQVSATA